MPADKKREEIIIHPFPPISSSESKVLILGSFPSVVSREQSFYYANKTNRFWKVMGVLFGQEIGDDSESRRIFCLKNGIGLWDVIKSCSVHGSSDASIGNVKFNEIKELIEQTKIHTVFTTGTKASDLYEKYQYSDTCEHISLPSTSAANARMRLDDLVKSYQIIVERIYEKN